MITDYAETYKKLKTQLIDNKRIYPIKKAILGKIADNENTLL